MVKNMCFSVYKTVRVGIRHITELSQLLKKLVTETVWVLQQSLLIMQQTQRGKVHLVKEQAR